MNLFCEKLSIRGMFLLLVNVAKDSVLDKALEGSVATDFTVKAQALMFVKYVDRKWCR